MMALVNTPSQAIVTRNSRFKIPVGKQKKTHNVERLEVKSNKMV